ncbi:posphoenolpyruvate synthetase regulatory kinase/phosphorylase PpsR [Coralloluteibacterium stylophorae]|uniref:Putative phosphoenolpyruvate synthase regulatory protein n=1 Tax=Coralloluteibacterium stylophorae TaxID=1776034 RepID=A0A8J8AYW8_9GAMM|nr:pyruvate, water dikinase regulatory protein [Coralloluteibacterium stylophorae]MBS7455758.1 kinase/pyrophosphorylase [Coralloluteibacterium stylophorae]
MTRPRQVFYCSDGTGITAETIGHSLLTQFGDVAFESHRIAFIDAEARARQASIRIRQAGEASGQRPIVVNTVLDGHLSALLAESGALMLDVFAPFLSPLEQELGVKSQPRVGQAHGLVDFAAYERRIEATNYALSHDDGVDVNYDEADLILVGVSRSGKTPTCLYMALHYGVAAANYPLTDDDLESTMLPKRLRAHRRKLFGLTIDPVRLAQIRQQRRPNSRYAEPDQCRREVAAAELLFRNAGLSSLNTTHTSIEEIASKVLSSLGIHRHLF